jgi:DNA-binding NarL/FixJ family response regulator
MQTTTTSPTVHTNAEIAAKLFSAAKTVDPYVSAELAKLDAPTRDVAASPATWLGLAGAPKYRA